MEIVKINNNNITLTETIRQWLKDQNELLAVIEGDTLVLKRLHLPSVEALIPDDQPAPTEEIVDEVKHYRRQRK